jgi:hypothetical protein
MRKKLFHINMQQRGTRPLQALPQNPEETANRFMKLQCISFAGQPCLRQASGLGATEKSISHWLDGRLLYASPCLVKRNRILFARAARAACNRVLDDIFLRRLRLWRNFSLRFAKPACPHIASSGES